MNHGKHSSRRFLCLMAGVILVVALAANPLFAGGIRVMVTPSNTQPNVGEKINVAITLQIPESLDRLGSYTAVLRWDPRVLKLAGHTGGATQGFSTPVINAEKATEGRLSFAHAYPQGGKGAINLLNLTFEVIGTEGNRSDFEVEFSAMAAALTFKNLLPQLETLTTGVKDAVAIAELPKAYTLLQNRPNPLQASAFTPDTEIGYELPKESRVVLTVFNLLGQRVKTLVNGTIKPGQHTIRWDGTDEAGKLVPSGIYIYRMETADFVQEKKMTLVR